MVENWLHRSNGFRGCGMRVMNSAGIGVSLAGAREFIGLTSMKTFPLRVCCDCLEPQEMIQSRHSDFDPSP